MNVDEKRVFLDSLYITFIESKELNLPETQSHFEKGVYTLVVAKNNEMSKIWESLNAYDAKFGEELRSLGIGLKVASNEAPEEKTKA
jgi:hypothetical protein